MSYLQRSYAVLILRQAAGLISVTHASGGPLHDIVVPYRSEPTGFHVKTPGEFSAVMHQVSRMIYSKR